MDINQFVQHIKTSVRSGVPLLQVPQRVQDAEKDWGNYGNTMREVTKNRQVTPQQLQQLMPMLFMSSAPLSNLSTMPLKVAEVDNAIKIMNQRYMVASGAERASMRPAILEAQRMREALAQKPTYQELMQEEALRTKLTQR